MHVSDDFNDNSLNGTLWSPLLLDGQASVVEVNQRLEYTSQGTTMYEDENAAYCRLNSLLPYDEPWMLTLDVHVETYDPTISPEEYEYGMEIGIRNPSDPDDKLWLGLYRGYDGDFGGIPDCWCVAMATNDMYYVDDSSVASGTSGTMRIEWDGTSMAFSRRESDAFVLLRDGVTFEGWGTEIEDGFELLIGAYDVGHPTALDDGTKLYADNFQLVPEPSAVCVLTFGAWVLAGRRRGHA